MGCVARSGFGYLFKDDPEPIIRDGIYRFTPDVSYSTGNFSTLRDRHGRLQIDRFNGTQKRLKTILERTRWSECFFRDKYILECGCGGGPDTDVLLRLGAKVVAVDIAGLDVTRESIGEHPSLVLMQASIDNLWMLRPQSFDIVFCHRVLQHTPKPAKTLRHILQFVKPNGAVFVHSYAKTVFQMCRWKYVLRPITTRMDPEKLYATIVRVAPAMYELTTLIQVFGKVGRLFNWIFVPFLNYTGDPTLRGAGAEVIIEYGIHDTFDALSPPYDRPISATIMRRVASELLSQPFEVVEYHTITLLRTALSDG